MASESALILSAWAPTGAAAAHKRAMQEGMLENAIRRFMEKAPYWLCPSQTQILSGFLRLGEKLFRGSVAPDKGPL